MPGMRRAARRAIWKIWSVRGVQRISEVQVHQEREEAGQTIDHMHMHIIPRKSHDLKTPGEWYPKLKQIMDIESNARPNLSHKEMEDTVLFLKQKAKEIL